MREVMSDLVIRQVTCRTNRAKIPGAAARRAMQETRMPIDKAREAAAENINQFVSAQDEAVMYNINIALLGIADAVQEILARLDDIEAHLKKPQRKRA
jgi:uncharacterized protein (DUF2164 family)